MHKITKSFLVSLLLGSALTGSALAALPQYVIKDVGSFGGGFGYYSNPASRALNRHGANVGVMATGADDPFCPDWCFLDGHVAHGFEWKHGHVAELGPLVEGFNSFAGAINDKGLIVGVSQNGNVDAATGAPVVHGVRWQDGQIADLGTLGGTQSAAYESNRSGQIVNDSSTSDSNDPFINVPQANCLWLANNGTSCGQVDFSINTFFLPVATQTHAAIWTKNGTLKDLGTLGGPDSAAYDINDNGQVVGWSYTSFQAGSSGVPDTHPFIWDNVHKMQDLGTLGGTFAAPVLINKNGQVTGVSNLSGDTVVRTFVWDKDNGMHDPGSLGGWYTHPNWINDNGDVVGISSYPDNTRRAVYWSHAGGIIDLGTIGTDDRSVAVGINNSGLIVGYTFTNGGEEIRGVISDNGGALVDLNTLIAKRHGLYVLAAYYINDAGEIVGIALTKSGEIHPVVLVPKTGEAADEETGADDSTLLSPAAHRAVHDKLPCGKGRMAALMCASR